MNNVFGSDSVALQKQWDENPLLTSWVNIPGLTIVNKETDADYCGVYRPEEAPICSCGRAGTPDGYYKSKIVCHLLNEPEDVENSGAPKPRIISIEIQCQEYHCPICSKKGKEKIIPYEPSFLDKGATTTKELNAYIGQQCLDRSPKKVASSLKIRGKTAVEDIFREWAKEQIGIYSSQLAAPKKLGFHLISVLGKQYYLISDIEDDLIIDIFEYGDLLGAVECLSKLAMIQNTTDVVTEIDRSNIVASRGVFRRDAVIRAAAGSICRAFANEVAEEMDDRYDGRGAKSIKEYLGTPIYEALPISPEVQRIIRKGLDGTAFWLGLRLIDFYQLRKIATDSWSKQEFTKWKSGYSALMKRKGGFQDTINYAEEEIDNSFDNVSLQADYNDTARQVAEIIQRNQKCNFELLRDRVLLKCNPKIVGYNVNGTIRYYYRGISLRELADTLQEYEE